jgi:hypothetical protein
MADGPAGPQTQRPEKALKVGADDIFDIWKAKKANSSHARSAFHQGPRAVR